MPIIFISSCLHFLWVTDIHPIQWKLFSRMRSFFLIVFSWQFCSPADSCLYLYPIRNDINANWKLCLQEDLGARLFWSLGIHYIKLLSSCWQPVVAGSLPLCLGLSVALSWWMEFSFGAPQLHRTSSESRGWYLVPMTNEGALLIEEHKRRKLLFSFKLLVICILLTSMSPSHPSGSFGAASCFSGFNNFCSQTPYILQP